MTTQTQTIRNRINRALRPINTTYHDAIPLDDIFNIVREHMGEVLDVDGTPWSGFLCGSEGIANFQVAGYPRVLFQVGWYKMPSGRYEINAYIS